MTYTNLTKLASRSGSISDLLNSNYDLQNAVHESIDQTKSDREALKALERKIIGQGSADESVAEAALKGGLIGGGLSLPMSYIARPIRGFNPIPLATIPAGALIGAEGARHRNKKRKAFRDLSAYSQKEQIDEIQRQKPLRLSVLMDELTNPKKQIDGQ